MALENSAPVCPTCGWTATQLRDTGRMGCADCYSTFSAMVEQAVLHLHVGAGAGSEAAPEDAPAPPAPVSAHEELPWPTRRAQRSR